jgi:hypothetical protein
MQFEHHFIHFVLYKSQFGHKGISLAFWLMQICITKPLETGPRARSQSWDTANPTILHLTLHSFFLQP